MPCVPLSNVSARLIQAEKKESTSDSVESRPKLTRTAPRASAAGTPMAASTWDAATLPEEQAAPDDTAKPAKSRPITAVSALAPGTATSVVFGSRSVELPKMMVCRNAAVSRV